MNGVIGAAAAAFLLASAASADTYTTSFEQAQGFATGSVAPGANEGNANWQAAANGSTFGTVVNNVAHSGTQSLAIGNNGSGNDGVIQGVRSPELLVGAGETQSGAAANHFASSFWFRTGFTDRGSDYFASINAWSTDRMTYVSLDYTGGVLTVYGDGYHADDTDSYDPIATGLALGEWYRLDQTVDFVNSANGGDDVVVDKLYNSLGTLVGSLTTSSWDAGYLGADTFYPGAHLTPVDQLNFRTAYTTPGVGYYIDDVTYSSSINAVGGVPEPATWGLMVLGFGAVGAGLRTRRRTAIA